MEDNLFQHMVNLTIESVKTISRNKGISFNPNEVKAKMQSTYKEKFASIFAEMQKDAKEADLFNQLERGKVGALSMQCARVSLHHGCVMYAKELLGITDKD